MSVCQRITVLDHGTIAVGTPQQVAGESAGDRGVFGEPVKWSQSLEMETGRTHRFGATTVHTSKSDYGAIRRAQDVSLHIKSDAARLWR